MSLAHYGYKITNKFFKSSLFEDKNVKVNGKNYIVVATTRPETMLGDTAVAVNPDDDRYKDIVGKILILPLVGRKLEII